MKQKLGVIVGRIIGAVLMTLVALIVIGGLVWVAQTVWSAVL